MTYAGLVNMVHHTALYSQTMAVNKVENTAVNGKLPLTVGNPTSDQTWDDNIHLLLAPNGF